MIVGGVLSLLPTLSYILGLILWGGAPLGFHCINYLLSFKWPSLLDILMSIPLI